jgi:hypothetical protein
MHSKRLEIFLKTLGVALAGWSVLMMNTATAQNPIYVSKAGSPDPDGSQSKPYQMVEAGIVRTVTSPANTVQIEAGSYYETFTTDIPSILEASGGTVTIGQLDYQAATTLEIITLNTHLFGDVVGPSWQDYERADDIADFFGGANPLPDVVGFQEIWDEDLFFGGDGANGILPRSPYLYGDQGEETNCGTCGNSGLAIMSKYPLVFFTQVPFKYCDGFLECQATKGWVHTAIWKDGFYIHLINTHTQAGNEEDDLNTRKLQLQELRDWINWVRTGDPGSVIFVMGDLNVYGELYGEQGEYNDVLIPEIGTTAGGRDADRNSPGFAFGSSKQWTYCICNPLAFYFDPVAYNGRLDYIFYLPSLDGSVEVIPTSVEVLPFVGRILSEDDLTTNQSSDHWGVYGQFTLIRP